MGCEVIKIEKIIKIMKHIRMDMEKYAIHNPPTPSDYIIWFEETHYSRESHILPIIGLISRPCHWLVKGGGCTMCGYNRLADFSGAITDQNLFTQLERVMETIDSNTYPRIVLTSLGSFMDVNEINEKVMFTILKKINPKGFERITFESRPEFLLDVNRLKELKGIVSGDLSISIGIESSDDYIRRYCLNKGASKRTILKALGNLKDAHIIPQAYVLIGKPFLSPEEDILDAVDTIKFARQNGVKEIILMITNLQKFTLTEKMSEMGMYALPKLWSAIRVIELLDDDLREEIFIKGYNKAIPPPSRFSTTCERCSSTIEDALTQWNLMGDFSALKKVSHICECRKVWENQIHDVRRIEERVKEYWGKIYKSLQ